VKIILSEADNAKIEHARSELFDAPRNGLDAAKPESANFEELLETTSDVREMKEAD